MTEIKGFFGEYFFLSNFYGSDVDGYPTVEHAFQAAKATNDADREYVKKASDAREAKKRGRWIVLRPDWESIKIETMRKLVAKKFQNPELRKKLLDTGEAYLEETNTWHDTFWGVCGGVGENWLGKILMEVRKYIREHSCGTCVNMPEDCVGCDGFKNFTSPEL